MKIKIKNKSTFIISILIPIAAGALSSLASGSMTSYFTLNKPPFAPPPFVFPLVWTILYILMGISSYLIYESNDPGREKALCAYAIQLFFNFFWSILFFRFSLYLFSFYWIIALILAILLMIVRFRRVDAPAAYLQIPYLLWCLFAAYLNFMIYRLN